MSRGECRQALEEFVLDLLFLENFHQLIKNNSRFKGVESQFYNLYFHNLKACDILKQYSITNIAESIPRQMIFLIWRLYIVLLSCINIFI